MTNTPTLLIANLSVYMQGQHYEEWESTLADLRNNPHINSLLVLPLRTEWQRCLVCTSSERKHTVRVTTHLDSSSSNHSRNPCTRTSKIDGKLVSTSHRERCGSCCTD